MNLHFMSRQGLRLGKGGMLMILLCFMIMVETLVERTSAFVHPATTKHFPTCGSSGYCHFTTSTTTLNVKALFPEPFTGKLTDNDPSSSLYNGVMGIDIHPSASVAVASANTNTNINTDTPSSPSSGGVISSSSQRAVAKKRVTLRRYLNNYVKQNREQESQLRDMESLSLSIQMACKTISNLVNRAGINSLSPPPYDMGSESEGATTSGDEGSRAGAGSGSDCGFTQYDMRMNSMKRLDQLSTTVLRNALRFTGKLQSVKTAKDEEEREEWGIVDGGDDHDDSDDHDGSTGSSAEGDGSQHQPGVLIASALDSKYVAYFDPLDGSGNADAAICTGTVFGIFKTDDHHDEMGEVGEEGIDNVVLGGGDGNEEKAKDTVLTSVLQPGKKLVAAGYCLYSSATILVFTLGEGTHGFTLDPQINEFVLTHPNIKIPPRGNVYSCNESNSEGWSEDVLAYLHALKSGENETKKKYALRYVGSMVGDIHRTLMYGGIFFYPGDSKNHPNGHLQLLYKVAPLSYVIEQAGGSSTNGVTSLMDVRPNRVHERSPCFIGSPEDIKEMKTYIRHEE